MDGVIVVDKPSAWTSHDVVGKMRRIAGTRRVGHLGTLDPLATGVLPLLLDRATRLSQFLMKADKVYEAEVTFGFATNSYDSQGYATTEPVALTLDRAAVERALEAFRGELMQTPPPVSAKKVDGVPAYKLERKNKPVELAPVPVTVFSLELTQCEGAVARLRVHCSSGTYVRAIAHELGQALGCGAHLTALRRTRAGAFTIEQARTLAELAAMAAEGRFSEAVIGAVDLLPEFPLERVDLATAALIRQGRDFRVSPFRARNNEQFVRAVGEDGQLVAIGQLKLPNLYHPMLVL
jgi:tRNA pseudouridine55 synthase